MAFSDEDKHSIIRLLGWPGNTLNPDSLSYNRMISTRLLTVLEYTENQALELVDRIIELDEKRDKALDSTGVKRIDDIEFFAPTEGGTKLDMLSKERKKLVKELSQLLEIPILGNSSMGNVCV